MIFQLLVLALTSFTVCFAQQEGEKGSQYLNNSQPIDRIVAIAGNEIILRSDVEMQYRSQQMYLSENMSDEEMKCLVLEDLLYQKLLLNQAKLDSLEITDDQVESELDRRMRYFINQIGSEQKLEEYYGKSIFEIKSEFRDLVKKQLLIQSMQSKITENIKASPSDVRVYFNKIPADSLPFINSEVVAAQIVRKPGINDEEKARVKEKLNGLRERIINGDNFGTLAYLYSEDPGSAKQNGELGFVQRGSLVPEFEAVAFNLKEDEVSKIVETQYGYHILQLVERRGEQINIRHILLIPRVSDEDLQNAKAFLDSVAGLIANDSLTFAEAALKFSEDEETKNNNGLMINPKDGTTRIETSQLDPVLAFVIDKMNKDNISEPVLMNTQDGKQAYRLVKLINRTEPHRANLTDDYQRIQSAALTEKKNKAVNKWIKKKIDNTYIRIDDEYKNCNFVNDWKTSLTENSN